MKTVYKIMSAADWREAQNVGVVPLADVDRQDGYVHLSGQDQVLETARLYFAGRTDLVAVAFDADDFGVALKWEASRGGALFPHLYGQLRAESAIMALKLVEDGAGFSFGENA